MIPNISQKRFTNMFIEGLIESTKYIIKTFEPQTLEEAIKKERKVESNNSRKRPINPTSRIFYQNVGEMKDNQNKPYYLCKKPWSTKHRCQQREELIQKNLCFK